MNKGLSFGILLFAIAGMFFSISTTYGDDARTPTLSEVHQILRQAAGYQSDTPPTPAEQIALLNKALKMIDQIPHVYHGELKAASRSINAALNELGNNDGSASKAKEFIYDADDQIRSIM